MLARETRFDALPGIVVPRLAGRTQRIQDELAASLDWVTLLDRLRGGPPLYSPFRWLDRIANVHELFVHHEDVRRAVPDWRPRALSSQAVATLRRLTAVMSHPVMAGIPAQVTLRTRDSSIVARVGRGSPVVVTAAADDLLLFVFGRTAIHAEFDGEDEAVTIASTWKRRV